MMTEPTAGHNSGLDETAQNLLRGYVQRLERLIDERDEKAAEYAEDIKDLKIEIKSRGYDMKALAEHLRRRKWERNNEDTAPILEIYEGVFA